MLNLSNLTNNYFISKSAEIKAKYDQEFTNLEAVRKIAFFVINEFENGLKFGKPTENGFIRFNLDKTLLKAIGVVETSEFGTQLYRCVDFFNGFGFNAKKDSTNDEKGYVYFIEVKYPN